MTGVTTIANELIAGAMATAEQDSTLDTDAMAHAILSGVLAALSANRSRKDIDNFIEFELDNLLDSDMVITRGC